MNEEKKRMFIIKIAYWLGIGADALWAVALLFPPLFGLLTGRPDFSPDLQFRLAMGIGGTLMSGWTLLLVWAVREPIERRFVILLTAFPVVLGMFVITLIDVLHGNTFIAWSLVKSTVLMLSMTTSYILAGKMVEEDV